jgi:hypothetical protein
MMWAKILTFITLVGGAMAGMFALQRSAKSAGAAEQRAETQEATARKRKEMSDAVNRTSGDAVSRLRKSGF